jgi:hypothetical protein
LRLLPLALLVCGAPLTQLKHLRGGRRRVGGARGGALGG